ncbi:MAG TPA: hypothetical protein VFQ45_07385 [Longimicrobium sp.]|nr:hypothetical protein [Longimicrobium sp.]
MKTAILGAALAALVVSGTLRAQGWSSSAPVLTVSAKVSDVRQVQSATVVHLSFGSDGLTAGTTKTVDPTDDDPAAGTGAKLDIRFNAGTRVSVTGTPLTAEIDGATHTLTPAYTCAVALDRTGTGIQPMAGGCATGYEWGGGDVAGMLTRTVMIGASIPAEESVKAPAGTYTGSLTVTLSASGA